jgi:SAM-dependent methyltransferase
MKDYYIKRKKWFEENYWFTSHNNLFIPNGVRNEFSLQAKLKILFNLIKKDGKIIDLGCGNGLLLKLLIIKSKQKLIPYGIDFLDKSIQQAKGKVLPKYKDNFNVSNVIEYDLNECFDYIITDPEYVSDEDIEYYYEKCFNALTKNGILIFFLPEDVLKRVAKRSKTLPFLKSKNLKWLRDHNMLCCYVAKE